MKKLNNAILKKQIKRFFKEQDAFTINYLPVKYGVGLEMRWVKAKQVIKEDDKLFVILGYGYIPDKKIELKKFNTSSLLAINAYLKAATTKLSEYEQWVLMHKTHFPDEPIKSWINENNFVNIYKDDIGSLHDLINHLLEEYEGIEGEIRDKYIWLKMNVWNEKVENINIITPKFLRNNLYGAVLNLVIQRNYIKNGIVL